MNTMSNTLDVLHTAFKELYPDGLPDQAPYYSASSANFTGGWQLYEGDVDNITDLSLPAYLQELLDADEVEDRSAAFHSLCLGLFALCCTSDCIIDVVEKVSWLPERYAARLDQEVYRCLSKYDSERSGFTESCTVLELAGAIDIDLSATDELLPEYTDMMEKFQGGRP